MDARCTVERWEDALSGLSPQAMGQLMPMFLWLDRRGTVRALGPTLGKILGPECPIGTPFAQHFQLGSARARRSAAAGGGAMAGGRRLHLTLCARPDISLRGSAVEVGQNGAEGVLVNLTFGIHLVEAVRVFGLTEADFAPSDLALELLYLQEAKTAVLDELRALNARLDDARRSAVTQALTDPLTGLANRRAFELALDKALQGLALGGAPFALAHVDLDHFKAVNDTLGHAAGDYVLTKAAEVLRAETRRGDVVARVGGDEFVLLLRGALAPARLAAMGARIIARLEQPWVFETAVCRISGSIGVALSAHYVTPDAGQMQADADAALYSSKRQGRGRCTIAGSGEMAEGDSRLS
jgi:diguanylate cyclase (GGDEF)-like protein